MPTELVLLGTAGAPMPVSGRLRISSAIVVDDRMNVMPLDARMPDPAALVRATDIPIATEPVVVCADDAVRVTAVPVTHGHAVPALAYRFDTADGSVVLSGDTTVNDDLVALAKGADILVHQVADLDYLRQRGLSPAELDHMKGLHTDVSEVGGLAERAGVGELILTHYLAAEPAAFASRPRRVGEPGRA